MWDAAIVLCAFLESPSGVRIQLQIRIMSSGNAIIRKRGAGLALIRGARVIELGEQCQCLYVMRFGVCT